LGFFGAARLEGWQTRRSRGLTFHAFVSCSHWQAGDDAIYLNGECKFSAGSQDITSAT
jgi:hypothetical protein